MHLGEPRLAFRQPLVPGAARSIEALTEDIAALLVPLEQAVSEETVARHRARRTDHDDHWEAAALELENLSEARADCVTAIINRFLNP